MYFVPQKLSELQVFWGESGEHSVDDQGDHCCLFFVYMTQLNLLNWEKLYKEKQGFSS